MIYDIAKELVLTNPGTSGSPLTTYEHSQPIALEGVNNVMLEAILMAADQPSTTGLDIVIQQSNDLENWTTGQGISWYSTLTAPQRATAYEYVGVWSNYLRVEYRMTVSGSDPSTIVVSAFFNVVRDR